jgi:hypothetical protein
METGLYKGSYQFNNERIGRQRGFEKTYFTIVITDSDGHSFNGWVEDDLSTGGMEGRGTVSGKLYSDGIEFVKNMPYLSIIREDSATGEYGQMIDKTKKHEPIYYDGVEIENNHYGGKWAFKYGVLMQVAVWLMGAKMGGTWEMSKVNN